MSVIFDNKAA